MSSRSRSSNIAKGTSRFGKDSSISTLSTKYKDKIAGGTNNAQEKEDQTDGEMENLEKSEINFLSPGAQENGWGPNSTTQMCRKTHLETEKNQRRQTNLGGIAETRRDSTNKSLKGNKPDEHGNLWG
eukprot:14418502-Ditylum_brightwellii.AAC.1